jgi:hypothetical protein
VVVGVKDCGRGRAVCETSRELRRGYVEEGSCENRDFAADVHVES